MGVLCIASDTPEAGKTALAGALLTLALGKGKRVAYFRPLPDQTTTCLDSAFIRGEVLGLEASAGQEPRGREPDPWRQAEAAARQAAAEGRELVLEIPATADPGADAWEHCRLVAEGVNGGVLAILEYRPMVDRQWMEAALAPLKGRLRGILVNLTPRYRVGEAAQLLEGAPEVLGSALLGLLPEDRGMTAPTVGQLAQHLDARWVTGQDMADRLVCHILMGGNIMDSAHSYFGRHMGQAVIVRGDRPDIQLAALSGSTTCLVLTGGHEPIPYVRNEAQERQAALLVTEGDTVATAQGLGDLRTRATVHHPRKVGRFLQLLERHGDLAALEGTLA